jgi:predicted nucleic acid-binding protein
VIRASFSQLSYLNEPIREKAKAIWRYWSLQDYQVAAPTLFRYEIVAVVRKHVHRGNITAADGVLSRNQLLSQPVQLFMTDNLLKRAYELATEFGRPTAYDSQYLAVAEYLKCEFWTADQRLFNVTSNKLSWVKWLGNFEPPQEAS